jgi:carboxyl-terminal processing protease
MKADRPIIYCLLLCLLALAIPVSAQNAADALQKATNAYNRKEYEKSAQLFISAVNEGANGPDVFYNAACSFALAGKKEEAIANLTQAINRGYFNSEHLQQDSDLNSLHDDARWKTLIEKSNANGKMQKALWDGAALSTPFRENLSDDEKVAGLSRFWSEVKFNFANFDLVPGLDWDALYLSYLPKVRETKSTLEYYRLLMEFCAQLKDGHTNVTPPEQLMGEVYSRPLIRTRLIEGHVIVIRVQDDLLQRDGLVLGLEVLEINSIPVKQYAEQRVMPFQSASTKQDLEVRGYEYALLAGSSKEPVEILFQDSAGQTFKKVLRRLTPIDREKAMIPTPAMEFGRLPGNIAYISLNTFNTNDVVKQFEAAYPQIEKTDAMILDIRNNGGGNSNNGYAILAYLTGKPFKTSQWKTRDYRPSYRAWQRPAQWYSEPAGEYSPNPTKLYTKPVIVLTSPRTFSAAEDFAVAFDFMKRGKIIGEATGGSTGQPLNFSLPGKGSARVCTKRDSYPDGKEFVGVGVQPHIAVQPKLVDFRNGRDTVLEAAFNELKSAMQK